METLRSHERQRITFFDACQRGCFVFPVAIIIVGLFAPAYGQQQKGFDAQNFRPSLRQVHSHSAFPIAEVPQELTGEVGVLFQYARDPLALSYVGGSGSIRSISVVESQSLAHLWGSVAVEGRLEVGLEFPVFIFQTSEGEKVFRGEPGADPGPGIADPRLNLKLKLFDVGELDSAGFTMALDTNIYAPLGNEQQLQGEAAIRGEFSLLNTVRLPRGCRITVKAGYYVRSAVEYYEYDVGDMVSYGLAVLVPINESFEVGAETFGGVMYGAEDISQEEAPLEAFAMGRYIHNSGMFIQAQVGGGIVRGAGTPSVRAGLSIGFNRSRETPAKKVSDDQKMPTDMTEKGEQRHNISKPETEPSSPISNEPATPGAQPTDGEPKADDDLSTTTEDESSSSEIETVPGSSVPHEETTGSGAEGGSGATSSGQQSEEKPPVEKEAVHKGSPTDFDDDGLNNSFDFCPEEAEDIDDVLDDDGCPETDADQDGVLDEQDICPTTPGGRSNGCR